MVQTRGGAVKVPSLDGDVQLLDLGPPSTGRGDTAEAGHVAEVVEGGRMQRCQRQLGELGQGGPLERDAQADEGVVDNVPTVALAGVLAGTPDGQVTHVGQVLHGIDEAGYVGSGVEQGRVLLGEYVAQLRVGVLGASEHGAHARVRRVQKRNLMAGERVDQRREEGGFGVREVKGEMLDVVTDAREGGDPGWLGEGARREGDMDARKEALGEEVAKGG